MIDMAFEIVKLVGLVLFSSVKFLFAPSTVYFSGYSYFETILITVFGGVLGVVVFFYTGAAFFTFLSDRFSRAGKQKKSPFTRRNRMIVKLKATWGLFGLAIVSPCLISIPIGSLLAAKYFRHSKWTLPFMIGSVVMWSFILTSISALIGPVFD